MERRAEQRGSARDHAGHVLRQVYDLYNFGSLPKDNVLHDIAALPPGEKVVGIKSWLTNIDQTLIETSDTGEWFQNIIELRKDLQSKLERYTSLEFKVEGLDEFLGEVKTRIVEKMREAHETKGNAWLWDDMPSEAAEEYLDAGAFSVLFYRKLRLEGLRAPAVPTLPIEGEQAKSEKTTLENKTEGFDEFVEEVRGRIIAGDVKYKDMWLVENQQKLIEEEVLDSFAYAYFGWRKTKMLQSQQASQPPEKKSNP